MTPKPISSHQQWATISPADRFSNGRPHICLWGDLASAIENRDPDEQLCLVRVDVLNIVDSGLITRKSHPTWFRLIQEEGR